METISERLKAYIAFKKISQRDFGESVGKSGGWVNNAGKSLKTETSDLIRKHYPDLNVSWVITGNGEMIIPKQKLEVLDAMQNIAPKQTRSELEDWLNITDNLQPEPLPDPMVRSSATRLWKKEVKDKLGIQKDLYSLKHKGVNDKHRNGMPFEVISNLMRHSSVDITAIYGTDKDIIEQVQNKDKFGSFE